MKYLLLVIAIFAGLMGVLLLARPAPGVLVENGLYPLQLTYVRGNPVQPGRVTILEFWGVNCPPCLESVPHLNSLRRKFAPRGLQLVGVTIDTPAQIEQFHLRTPIEYAVAHDPDLRLTRLLNVYGIPDALVLNRQGTIIWRGDPRHLTETELEKFLAM